MRDSSARTPFAQLQFRANSADGTITTPAAALATAASRVTGALQTVNQRDRGHRPAGSVPCRRLGQPTATGRALETPAEIR